MPHAPGRRHRKFIELSWLNTAKLERSSIASRQRKRARVPSLPLSLWQVCAYAYVSQGAGKGNACVCFPIHRLSATQLYTLHQIEMAGEVPMSTRPMVNYGTPGQEPDVVDIPARPEQLIVKGSCPSKLDRQTEEDAPREPIDLHPEVLKIASDMIMRALMPVVCPLLTLYTTIS